MSDADAEKMVYVLTHGVEDPERCTFPFVLAGAALAMDIHSTVVLQGSAVFLAKKGIIEHITVPGLTPLKSLVDAFLEGGGEIMVCIPCLEERGIKSSDLIEGATLGKAGKVVSRILEAKATLVY
ncbi:MAG: DsrE family protein [Thermodesulfobacteriota bacterium]